MGCPWEAIWWRVAGGCHRAAPTALHGVSAGKPRHRRALSRSAPSKAQGRSTARNPRARPSHAVKATAWGHGHSEGTLLLPAALSLRTKKVLQPPKLDVVQGQPPSRGCPGFFQCLSPSTGAAGLGGSSLISFSKRRTAERRHPGAVPASQSCPGHHPRVPLPISLHQN